MPAPANQRPGLHQVIRDLEAMERQLLQRDIDRLKAGHGARTDTYIQSLTEAVRVLRNVLSHERPPEKLIDVPPNRAAIGSDCREKPSRHPL